MQFLQLIVLTLAALICAFAPACAETRVALVIGNAACRHVDRLDDPIDDARGARDALSAVKFGVVCGEYLDLHAMRLKAGAFAGRVDDVGAVLPLRPG